MDGVPTAQPALALAAKLVSRARRAGLPSAPVDEVAARGTGETGDAGDADRIGLALLAIVGDAVAVGVDPETALRRIARRYRATLLDAERPGATAPGGATDRT